MRKLKYFGLNSDGLKTFYISYIRSVLLYGAPVWNSFLSLSSKEKLKTVKRSASRIFTPDLCHTYRLDFLSVPLFNYFNFSRCAKHFERRSSNRLHPLLLALILPISRDLPMPRMYVRKFPKPRSG